MENVHDKDNELNKLNNEEQENASVENSDLTSENQEVENSKMPDNAAAPSSESNISDEDNSKSIEKDSENVLQTANMSESSMAESSNNEQPSAENEENSSKEEDNDEAQEEDENTQHEEEHEGVGNDDEEIDFSHYTREDLLAFVREAAEKPMGRNIGRKVQQAKSEFNRQTRELLDEAKADWNTEEHEEGVQFQAPEDKLIPEFGQAFKLYKKNRLTHIEELNQQKEVNLQNKKRIIERLKELTETDETGASFEEFKKLQQEWRTIGHVPIAETENLWNNYNFYIDRFYEQRSLYSEFKELDRKKNLAAKEEVVNRIEALDKLPELDEALKLLKQCQEEWRHIGPVPREQADEVIKRYKEAIIKLYEKKEKQSEELKKHREQNHEAKLAILEKIEELANAEIGKVQDWIDRNKELGQWIENWKSLGSVPITKMQELKDRFTAAVRLFNKKKNDFFRNRKKEKVDNLKEKVNLCERVEEILKSDNLQSYRKEVIKLQDDWKKIGPIPQKYSDKTWKRFIAACDLYFEKFSELGNQRNNEQVQNLEAKKAVIAKAEELGKQEKVENPQKVIRELQDEWNAIGFVPFKEKDKIRKQFFDALNSILGKTKGEGMEGNENVNFSYQLQLQNWSQEPGGDRKLDQELQRNFREIKKLENEIATLENNMEFFSQSKNADKLRANIEKQVATLRKKMTELQEKINLIRQINK